MLRTLVGSHGATGGQAQPLIDIVRAGGGVADNAELAIVATVMEFAVGILRMGKQMAHVTNLTTASDRKSEP